MIKSQEHFMIAQLRNEFDIYMLKDEFIKIILCRLLNTLFDNDIIMSRLVK